MVAGIVRLLFVAILFQPAFAAVRSVVPTESAESQESEPAGETDPAESELSNAAEVSPRFHRRSDRRWIASPASLSRAWTVTHPRHGLVAGHRLPNGLRAPLRC